jgi:hypothetical protein
MSDAVRALQQRRAMDALKLERLRQSIDAGSATSTEATMRRSTMPSLKLGSIASSIRPPPELFMARLDDRLYDAHLAELKREKNHGR